MCGTVPTSQGCLTAYRRAADLDAYPPMPMHSLSTATVTFVLFRFSCLVVLILLGLPFDIALNLYIPSATPFYHTYCLLSTLLYIRFLPNPKGLGFSRSQSYKVIVSVVGA